LLQNIPKEKDLHIRILTVVLMKDDLKYVAKTVSIQRPLWGIGRGRFQPAFGKQTDIWAFFPQESKRSVFQSFPIRSRSGYWQSEPNLSPESLPSVHDSFFHAFICFTTRTSIRRGNNPLVLTINWSGQQQLQEREHPDK